MRLHFRHRLMQLAVLVSFVAAGWACAVVLTGGVVADWGWARISSRHALNPAILAGLSAVGAFALATADQRRYWPDAIARGIAVAAVVGSVSFGLGNGLFVAAASDAYGYVSQADLWVNGDLVVRQPWARDMTWPNAANALAPLGYRPHRPAAHGTDIVPIYSPGVPMLMAAFKTIAGPQAVYFVVPLLGGAAVWVTFLMGRRLSGPFVGAAAAVLLATSPTFLFEVTAPASDVAATAWWSLALYGLMRQSPAAALGAGAAAGAAILTRPNVAPLALVLMVPDLIRLVRRPHDRQTPMIRLLLFCAGAVPACVVVAWLNSVLYGSPLATGYGSFDHLYQLEHAWRNLTAYPRWLVETQTPLIVFALLSPFLLRSAARAPGTTSPESIAALWLAAAAAVFGLYVLYLPFEEWWYLRFLLPVFPALFVLMSVAVLRLTAPFGRLGSAVHYAVAATILSSVAFYTAHLAYERGAARVWEVEQRYLEAGHYVASALPGSAAILSVQHSGSVRFYSGRISVRYDQIAPGDLDDAVEQLRQLGYRPYLLLDAQEEEDFRRRFAGATPLGLLDWAPSASLHRGSVRLYDPADR
jgi:hypothetical protein